jgi:3-dehydroquinate synthase
MVIRKDPSKSTSIKFAPSNFTSSWSPLHELVPETPLRHGHAISIDMAYSATLAMKRGLLSADEHRRLLNLFSRAGLSIDHPQFDDEVLEKGTAAILKTRDGLLRLAVPNPLGSCKFINDVSEDELRDALREHKSICKTYPREGAGIEAYVDSSDTGYTENGTETSPEEAAEEADIPPGSNVINGANSNGHTNGDASLLEKAKAAMLPNTNGHTKNPFINGVKVQA